MGSDRFALLERIPAALGTAPAVTRGCQIELFDYPKRLTLEAKIDLARGEVQSTREVAGGSPPLGPDEEGAARVIAEVGELGDLLARHPGFAHAPQSLTGQPPCDLDRCVRILYSEVVRTEDAGSADGAAGDRIPNGARVQPLATALVDLTAVALVQWEGQAP